MEQPPPREARVPVNLRIKFRSETIEQFVDRYAVDVSRGGIFIRTREPLAVGTQLKFDFQLQDTSPLMAGEGTVVWIREHEPARVGVTPGMGVRFDKLTPASQPVLEKILADKGRREASGPAAAGAASATVSGKSGAAGLPVRRPSSTFSAVDPGAASSPVAAAPALIAPATLLFGAAPSAAAMAAAAAGKPTITAAASAAGRTTQSSATALPGAPPGSIPATRAPTSSSGALPMLETQSALGRLATGPNLSTFGPVGGAPRTKSPLPLLARGTGEGDGSRPNLAGSSGAAAVPTPLEDSERTQIAEGLPEFSSQPTHVGGPSLGLNDAGGSSRAATITATSRRIPTPPPQPKLSLDASIGPSVAPAPPGPEAAGARTTSPDGTSGADIAAAGAGARLSASQAIVSSTGGATSAAPGTLESDLARTVPAAARVSAIAATTVRSTTPHATPRVEPQKKRPTAFIVFGVLIGAAAAVGIAVTMMKREAEPAATATAESPPSPAVVAPLAPAAPPAAGATPEATKTDPAAAAPAGANPATEPQPGQQAVSAQAKAAEGAAAIVKPAEAKPAEGATAADPEAKPAEAAPVKPGEAEASGPAPTKPGRKPRVVAHKKGTPISKAEAALESGGDGADGAEGTAGNLARIVSLPPGAEVLIDGQSVGKTPFQGKDIDPAAPHALTVRKDGFETYEHMISASDWLKGKGTGQNLKVTVKLRKTHAEGEGGGEKKTDKPSEPAAESGKAETPPAAEAR